MSVPELVKERREPVLAALEPDKVTSIRLPVKPVAEEARLRALPEVRELAVILAASVVVPVKV